MNKRLRQLFEECRGEGYVDVVVLILCTVLVLALALRVLPVFIQKQQLDQFASFPITLRAQATGKSEVYWK